MWWPRPTPPRPWTGRELADLLTFTLHELGRLPGRMCETVTADRHHPFLAWYWVDWPPMTPMQVGAAVSVALDAREMERRARPFVAWVRRLREDTVGALLALGAGV